MLLKPQLAKLRQAFNLWKNKVLRAFAVVFVLLALIGGSVWWFGYSQHRDLLHLSAEARHITREKSARSCSSPPSVPTRPPSPRRQGLRAGRNASASAKRPNRPMPVASLASMIEGTGRSTQVFDEMIRILAEEGVDQALAYVATQRPGILEKVKARATAAREKNRADLLPLLKSAQLQADRNQPDEATHLFAEILAVEPDWPDALDAQFWFLITQGDHAFNHAILAEAFGHFQAAETTVQRLLKAEPDAPRFQRDLSVSYSNIGDVQRAQGDLSSALSSYKQGLEIREKLAARDPANTEWQRDLSATVNRR